MKRLLSILLLAVFLFNLFGYRLLLDHAAYREDIKLQARIDQGQLDDAYLVSIKTPLNLPYYYNSENFETVSGSVELNGVEYKYVKRRVFNDSLELMCYPNLAKKTVSDAKNILFKLSTETPVKEKKGTAFKAFSPDYWQDLNDQYQLAIQVKDIPLAIYQQVDIISPLKKVQEQPPEIM